jgi:hypothetical protein
VAAQGHYSSAVTRKVALAVCHSRPRIEGSFKEVVMKKTYAAPAVATSGDVVRDTLSGPTPNSFEVQGQYAKKIAGSVGFCL